MVVAVSQNRHVASGQSPAPIAAGSARAAWRTLSVRWCLSAFFLAIRFLCELTFVAVSFSSGKIICRPPIGGTWRRVHMMKEVLGIVVVSPVCQIDQYVNTNHVVRCRCCSLDEFLVAHAHSRRHISRHEPSLNLNAVVSFKLEWPCWLFGLAPLPTPNVVSRFKDHI